MPGQSDPRLSLPTGGAGTRLQVSAGVVALRKTAEPDGVQVSQALHGEIVALHHEEGEFGLVQSEQDHYTGWALMATLSAPVIQPTHRVKVARAHLYAEPSVKAAPYFLISLGARVTLTGEQDGRFVRCARKGWIIADHLAPLSELETDPAGVAERFLGTPYLWGGRESLGIDCSGLMQQAFDACGVQMPRDSDMQAGWMGEDLPNWAEAGALQRGDLVFWKGHVGIMLDDKTLLHSNGHHMATAAEPLSQAIERIAPLYGEPTGARRVDVARLAGKKPDWIIPG